MQRSRNVLAVPLAALLVAACATTSVHAPPASSGMSSSRLQALTSRIRDDVARGEYPGAVLVIVRDGKTVLSEAFGAQDPTTGAPMRPDSVFRIASMTKPVVSVAVLALVEDGKIGLGNPASRYLPELKGLKVGVERKDAAGTTVLEEVTAEREMTVQDLLRHTAGLTYGIFGDSLVDRRYREAKLLDPPGPTSDEFLRRLAALPLAQQPGKSWQYSRATDVLGVLVERVSGKPLDAFLSERILAPLGMSSSGFFVQAADQGRLAQPFAIDPDTKAPTKVGDMRTRPAFLSGGGGMVSTAGDYARFAQMLLAGGTLDGVRILSRKSVELMTSDALPPGAAMPWPGDGFGLGVAVRTSRGVPPAPGSVGAFGWAGIHGTSFTVDPAERLVAVWMVQRASFPAAMATWARYRAMIYAAVE